MPQLGEASIRISTKHDDSGIKDAESSLSRLGGVVGRIGTIAVAGFAALGAATAAGGIKAVQAYGELQQSEVAFTTLLKDRGKALEAIKQIQKDAAETPFGQQDLIKANQLLISAGVSADEARKDIKNLGNAISATGGGTAELNRLATNLQQIKAVGEASSLDIKQFAFAGINIYEMLAQSTGKTVAEVKDSAISYDVLTAALEKASGAGGMFEGAMEAQSTTINGAWSNLKDNLLIGLAEIGRNLNERFNLGVKIQEAATMIQNWTPIIIENLFKVIDWVSSVVTAFQGWWKEIQDGTSSISPILDAFRQFWVDTLQPILVMLGEFAMYLWEKFSPTIIAALNLIIPALKIVWNTIVTVFTVIKKVLEAFKWAWENNFLGIKTIVEGVVNSIVGYFNKLVSQVTTVMNFLIRQFNKLADFVPGMLKMSEIQNQIASEVNAQVDVGGFSSPNQSSALYTPAPNQSTVNMTINNNIQDPVDLDVMMRDIGFTVATS